MDELILDCLLSDRGEEEMVRGASDYSRRHPDVLLDLFGTKERMEKTLKEEGADLSRFRLYDSVPFDTSEASSALSMMRDKRPNSIRDSMTYLRDHKEALGVLTAGPTGMVLVSVVSVLGMVEGVHFPALGALLRNVKGRDVLLLDCGANLEVPPERLLSFARIGEAFFRPLAKDGKPRVGLLNVGKEEGKGDSLRKKTYALLKESGLNFVGNLEGSDLLLDKADVVVTDGFTGNALLKDTEATALIAEKMLLSVGGENEAFKKAASLIDENFHYTLLGGSILLGSRGLVVKAHGAGDRNTVVHCLDQVRRLGREKAVDALEAALRTED